MRPHVYPVSCLFLPICHVTTAALLAAHCPTARSEQFRLGAEVREGKRIGWPVSCCLLSLLYWLRLRINQEG